ncbi:MAG TPA: DUF2892 domain-containing protein [Polyangiaceae bacterium]|nr:DUF2892 domain-containing protein [Polyangiaceae bacterium]
MQENVGDRDRVLRFGVGGALLIAGLLGLRRGRLGPALLFASGAMVLESAVTRVCPVNSLLGVDTRADQSRSGQPQQSETHQPEASPMDAATASVLSSPASAVPNHSPDVGQSSEMTPIANRFPETLPGTS